MARRVLAPVAMLGLIGAGSLVLQRWVAETFLAATLMSVGWALLVGGVFLLHARRDRALLGPVLTGLALGAIGGAGAFWYFSVRDVVVDEDIVQAAPARPGSGSTARGGGGVADDGARSPIALASGAFSGEDGHDGSGTATVVETPDWRRLLTFTDFDVSPGPDVDVYLTPASDEIEDRVVLGDLKGNVGDQQYTIPASADVGRYDNVILYCVSFTVRIAVAPLRA